jgi:NADPH-ferrihemoprotein reductase
MTSVNRNTTFSPAVPVMATSSSDLFILSIGVALAALYIFRDQLFSAAKPKEASIPASKQANGSGNPRDFIAKMKEAVSTNPFFPFIFFIIYS